jgi:transketolase
MRNTFIGGLLRQAKTDESILLLTGDLGYGVVDTFQRELPDQFINFGINEQSMMGAAAGLAASGYKPFVYSIGNFPTFRCLEQVRNDVAYMNLNVTIVALGAGFSYGTAGYSHHLIEDLGALTGLPNIKTYSPADSLETKSVLKLILENESPKYVRLGKGGEPNLISAFDNTFPGLSILKGNSDFAIITTGSILNEAIKLRELCGDENPTILSFHDLSVISLYLSQHKFSKIITIEEHILRGGFGSLVAENLNWNSCDFERFGISKVNSELSGSQIYLRDQYGLSAEKIFLASQLCK